MTALADMIEAIPRRVHAELGRRDLTYRDLARESGIALNTAYRVAQQVGDPRLSTIATLARWLDDSADQPSGSG